MNFSLAELPLATLVLTNTETQMPVYHIFEALDGVPPTSNFPQLAVAAGTNFPVPGLNFDASTEEAIYFFFRALAYAGGDITVDLEWEAVTASSGDVVWGGSIAAITPNTDTVSVESKSFDTEDTVTDSHLGTTGTRVHRATLTITHTDSLAPEDYAVLKIARKAAAAGDTMTGDCRLLRVTVTYAT